MRGGASAVTVGRPRHPGPRGAVELTNRPGHAHAGTIQPRFHVAPRPSGAVSGMPVCPILTHMDEAAWRVGNGRNGADRAPAAPAPSAPARMTAVNVE